MSQNSTSVSERRPLQTRQRAWAQRTAASLARRGVSPNTISLLSIAFAAGAAAALVTYSGPAALWLRSLLLLGAATAIQLRLLCNMLDGMVAVEGSRRTATGDLYNEVPDRIADAMILVGAGYGVQALPGAVELGWGCALAAVLTAYVRALGRSLGGPMCFHGPMAKPHRMAAMTAGCIGAAIAVRWRADPWIIWAVLVLILLGSLVTSVRRLLVTARYLESR